MTLRKPYSFTLVSALFVLAAVAQCVAADLWVAATDPAIVTNNDCGQIAAISGRPMIRRSFHTGDAEGVAANIADRISSGDELVVPAGSRIEWITGVNTVAVLGSGGRVRFDGLRTFVNADGMETARLDVTVLAGEARVQVRLNESKPETVLAVLGGAEILVARGDVELFANGSWRGAVLAGQAAARNRRGAMPGAPFAINAGTIVDVSGESRLSTEETNAIKLRVPFSFESARAALPPIPAVSIEMEAP